MTEILGAIRNLLGYPWQKDWPKPPEEAQLFTGVGIPFASNVILTAILVRQSFQELINEEVGNLIFLVFLLGSGAYILTKNEKWQLWIWKDGAILHRGFDRIQFSAHEVARFREVGGADLFLVVASKNKRHKLPLEFMSNLRRLRNLLGELKPNPFVSNIASYSTVFKSQKSITTALLSGAACCLDLAKSNAKLFALDGSIKFWTLIYFLVILACIVYIFWSLFRKPRIFISIDGAGLRYRRMFSKRVLWKDVIDVRIKESDCVDDSYLAIRTAHDELSIPFSIPNYWHLEGQILERIPNSTQVTRL